MFQKMGRIIYTISRCLFEITIRVLLRISIYGRENIPEAPYVIVSNHTSLLDPPLIGIAFKKDQVGFMAKEELFEVPFVGGWIRAVGGICIKRHANSTEGLKTAITRLKEGHVISVFPEGTRSDDGNLLKAKKGVGFIIAKAKVPVVPLYVDEARRAFPKGKGIKVGTHIRMSIGEPIMPDDPDMLGSCADKDYGRLSDIVMNGISKEKEGLLSCDNNV